MLCVCVCVSKRVRRAKLGLSRSWQRSKLITMFKSLSGTLIPLGIRMSEWARESWKESKRRKGQNVRKTSGTGRADAQTADNAHLLENITKKVDRDSLFGVFSWFMERCHEVDSQKSHFSEQLGRERETERLGFGGRGENKRLVENNVEDYWTQ